jgi:glutathione S-transferase
MSVVELYSHCDCHLCEQARLVLHRLQAEYEFELLELDIRADDALHRAYFERVPVIALDGEELCEYVVDEPLLRQRLAARDHRLESAR